MEERVGKAGLEKEKQNHKKSEHFLGSVNCISAYLKGMSG